jgi:very-short-patch-repair endonuclease
MADGPSPSERGWLRAKPEDNKFRRQVPIGRYVADFACHEARLIIEIDGGQHGHASELEVARTGFLQTEGYRILRFWNNEVLTNADGVYQTIAPALGRITPTQTLPHQGRGLSITSSESSPDETIFHCDS